MAEKPIELKDTAQTSTHTEYLARMLPSLHGIDSMFTVLGILCKLCQLAHSNGVKINTREYLFPDMTPEKFDKLVGIAGFTNLAKDIIWQTDAGLVMNSYFFVKDGLRMTEFSRRRANAARQKKYRAARKKRPTPVQVSAVQTTIAAVPSEPEPPPSTEPPKKPDKKKKEDKKPPNEPNYRTYKGDYITGEYLVWWNMFWKSWGAYGVKNKAADPFLKLCKLSIIADDNIEIICEAAAYDATKREGLKAQQKTPVFPQGWLSGCRWETYEEKLKSGKIQKRIMATRPLKDVFPHDWKRILNKIIWGQFPDLIGKLESGHYKEPGDLTPELKDLVMKYPT